MRRNKLTVTLVLFAVALGGLAAIANASTFYTNPFTTASQLAQMSKDAGRHCTKRGVKGLMEITLGAQTRQCTYRTPIVGRNLIITVAEKLSQSTPRSLQGRAFVGVSLRNLNGAKYELRVFPKAKVWRLIRFPGAFVLDCTGGLPNCVGTDSFIKGVGGRNRVRLGTTDKSKNKVEVVARINGKKVGAPVDVHPLAGGNSTVTVGSRKASGKGVRATFDNVAITTLF